jgi:hypothetical protein
VHVALAWPGTVEIDEVDPAIFTGNDFAVYDGD